MDATTGSDARRRLEAMATADPTVARILALVLGEGPDACRERLAMLEQIVRHAEVKQRRAAIRVVT